MNFIHVVRKYMPGHILAYTASLLLGILAQAVVLLQPQLSGALIDGVQQHKAIVLIAVQLGILFILGAVLTAIQQAILGTIGEKSLYSIRNSMVDKFFRMSLLDREQKPPAWYSQRVSNDAALIKSVPSQFLSLVQGIILIVGSGVCLVWLDPIFFVIVLIPAGFSISLMLIATKPVKKLQNNLQNATMDMTSTVQEAAASMRTLEAYNSIDPEKKQDICHNRAGFCLREETCLVIQQFCACQPDFVTAGKHSRHPIRSISSCVWTDGIHIASHVLDVLFLLLNSDQFNSVCYRADATSHSRKPTSG